jgi:hypothetical protein
VADSNAGTSRPVVSAISWSPLRGVAVLAALLLVSTGPALFSTLNRLLDRAPSGAFVGLVTDKYATKGQGWHLTLKGAPRLPTPNNTIDVQVSVRDYDNAPVGDSVFVVVKPGFFGRSWIVSYSIQTPQDRIHELLQRHHALERRGGNEPPHP